MYRKDDQDEKTRFRMDRIYMSNGTWYFSTREGEEVGPFVTRGSASNGVAAYIRHTKTVRTNGKYAAKVAYAGLFASTLYR
jgi:hypothetical protein